MATKTLADWPKEDKEKFGICPLTAERWGFIDAMMSVSEDFSDGAFHGFMAEKGIDVAEIAAWMMHRDEGYPFLEEV